MAPTEAVGYILKKGFHSSYRRTAVMTMRKRLVVAIGIVVFLVCCSTPASAQRGGGLPGNTAVASKYYEDNLSKCGDSSIGQWTFPDRSGSRLVEIKGVRYITSPIPLSQADRLNGLEDAFESWIQPTAVRTTSSPRDNWEAWRDEKTIFRFRFLKVKGNWSITPVSAGFSGIHGYLAKYSCEDVPGHPARLAREQAERDRAQRAAQAEAAALAERDRVERVRVAKAIVGEWVVGDKKLTITQDGDAFAAVEDSGLRYNWVQFMRGELQSDGTLHLTQTRWERKNPRLGTDLPKYVYWLKLSEDEKSLSGRFDMGGMGGTISPWSRR